jgi:D-sedoheptulose 7-phosphate isomerase
MKKIIEKLKQVRNSGNQVFVCGNGGSSANAEHFTNDLFSKGIKAHCLNSNTSILTMISNDFGYENVFNRQLELFYNQGDVVILISCSGTSKNILKVLSGSYDVIKIFGCKGTYGDMESAHQTLLHKISESL